LVSKRTWQIAGGVVFAVSVTLLVWQGSFTFGDYAPASIEQTYLFWAVSTLIFLLTVTLGFMLFRTAVKLYIERQRNRESTGIKTKMVVGALALSFLPVFFLVLFSISVLNRNLEKWFSRPAMNVRLELGEVSAALDDETRLRARAQARWLAGLPEIARYLETGVRDREALQEICRQEHLLEAEISYSGVRLPVCAAPPEEAATAKAVEVQVPLGPGATLAVKARMPVDLALKQEEISRHIAEYDRLTANRKATRNTYLMLLGLITLFILFVATWIALFLARQIIVPVSALLKAASQVRQGNLGYRVRVEAIDELASLVRAFNDMTRDLQANARELESRRRFIEAIVENIPTGVVSIAADGAILTVNRALSRILDPERVGNARRIEDLFPAEDASEIRYLMNRARRIGVASQQFELGQNGKERHLAVTISALEDRASSGFVVVIEDTTDLLLAQKAALARGGPPHRARAEESDDADHALGRAHRPAGGARQPECGPARAGGRGGLARERRHHHSGNGVRPQPGGRIRAVCPVSRSPPGACFAQRSRRKRAGGLHRAARRHRAVQRPGARSAAGQHRSRAVQARGGELSRQLRRGHAGVVDPAAVRGYAPGRSGYGRAGGGRHRLRRDARRQGEALSAVFLDQGAGYGAGSGDRQPHPLRSRRADPGRR